MPNNDRRDWHRRMKAVEREYQAVALSVQCCCVEVAAGRVRLPYPLEQADLRLSANFLPGTYLLRVVAVFEAAVRSYWVTLRNTEPQLFAVIDGLASRQRVPDDARVNVHEVRDDRNRMIHETGDVQLKTSFPDACRRLHAFLSWLPDMW